MGQLDGSQAQRKQGGWNPETFGNNKDTKSKLVKRADLSKTSYQRRSKQTIQSNFSVTDTEQVLVNRQWAQPPECNMGGR